MQLKRNLLSAALASAIVLTATGVQAQTAQTATDLDTVQVTGIRGSMEKSLDTKREANARVEVVTAEDVGKLPAHNVADTLQRLPGVSVDQIGGADLSYSDSVIPELDISYYLTDNIAAELILGTTSANIYGEGSLASLGKVGKTWVLPPTLTLPLQAVSARQAAVSNAVLMAFMAARPSFHA